MFLKQNNIFGHAMNAYRSVAYLSELIGVEFKMEFCNRFC